MIQEEFSYRKEIIRERLKQFSKVSEKDYFYELCFCLLTPGSKARQAEKVIEFLKKEDFENKEINFGNELKKVRFHNTKKQRLIDMKAKYPTILGIVRDEPEPILLREKLVEMVDGLGYKEASHFLRNIGKKNLVIIDRHILKNMVRHKILESYPKSLSKGNYLRIENKFKAFANANNITVDELDLLFWSFETGEVFK